MGIVNRLGLEKSVILLAAVVSFVTAFLANISVALPLIARELSMSNIVQNWVATIFLLAIAALYRNYSHYDWSYHILLLHFK